MSEIQVDMQQIQDISDYLQCVNCGYNLKGLSPDRACPECGLEVVITRRADTFLTKRQFTAILLRCIAVYLFLVTLASAVMWVMYAVSNMVGNKFLGGGIHDLLMFAANAIAQTIILIATLLIFLSKPRPFLVGLSAEMVLHQPMPR